MSRIIRAVPLPGGLEPYVPGTLRFRGSTKTLIRAGKSHWFFESLVVQDFAKPSQRFRGRRFGWRQS